LLTSKKNLKIFSAITWIFGGLILFVKGYLLLKEANSISYNMENISMVLVVAFILGQIKSKFIMEKFCKKNLIRITELKEPKIYQFFEFQFFLFLALMISTGLLLSGFSSGNYNYLLFVGAIDLTLSTSLLKSSTQFFK
jgi:hypothetical protein